MASGDSSPATLLFDVTKFILNLKEVSTESEVFCRLIQRVSLDLQETCRLLELPEVTAHLAEDPGDSEYIHGCVKSTKLALAGIGKFVEDVRLDVHRKGTISLAHRAHWVLMHQSKLTSRQYELDTCHHSLMQAMNRMQGWRNNAPVLPSYEEASGLARPGDESDCYELTASMWSSPHVKRRRRQSQKPITTIEITQISIDKKEPPPVPEPPMDDFDKLSITFGHRAGPIPATLDLYVKQEAPVVKQDERTIQFVAHEVFRPLTAQAYPAAVSDQNSFATTMQAAIQPAPQPPPPPPPPQQQQQQQQPQPQIVPPFEERRFAPVTRKAVSPQQTQPVTTALSELSAEPSTYVATGFVEMEGSYPSYINISRSASQLNTLPVELDSTSNSRTYPEIGVYPGYGQVSPLPLDAIPVQTNPYTGLISPTSTTRSSISSVSVPELPSSGQETRNFQREAYSSLEPIQGQYHGQYQRGYSDENLSMWNSQYFQYHTPPVSPPLSRAQWGGGSNQAPLGTHRSSFLQSVHYSEKMIVDEMEQVNPHLGSSVPAAPRQESQISTQQNAATSAAKESRDRRRRRLDLINSTL